VKKWKIPILNFQIVKTVDIEKLKERLSICEREFKRQLISNEIRSKQIGNLQHKINVMLGLIPAPLCPKCDKPKTPGGIQWLDHVECCSPKQKESHSR
jgi:hypothetical protein